MRWFVRVFAVASLAFALPHAAAAEPVDLGKLMAPSAVSDMALGDPAAPVTIVEYASLTCSHCGNFYRNTFPTLKQKYIDTGKVRFILREYPLDQLALVAAMIARCGPDGKYFDMIHTLFNEQQKWAFGDEPGKALLEVMAPYGVTDESIRTCLADEKLVQGVIEVSKRGQSLGVSGTPTFFINGEPHTGEIKATELASIIDPLLATAE